MNILILGKGFVGRALKEQIPNAFIFSKDEFDYTDDELLNGFIIKDHINVVVNCSGYTGSPNVDACEENKELCYINNVITPQLILNAIPPECKMIHVSSGCIYDGYDKVYIEEDVPNFGIFSDRSSFYSKTKHIAEMNLNWDNVAIVRLRIPFDFKPSNKNYFNKLLNYDNLINFKNSKTDLRYLCRFIEALANNFTAGIFNAIHSNALDTLQVIAIMREFGLYNPNWKIVPYDKISIKANRSNCILSNEKVKRWGFDFVDETQALREALEKYTKLI